MPWRPISAPTCSPRSRTARRHSLNKSWNFRTDKASQSSGPQPRRPCPVMGTGLGRRPRDAAPSTPTCSFTPRANVPRRAPPACDAPDRCACSVRSSVSARHSRWLAGRVSASGEGCPRTSESSPSSPSVNAHAAVRFMPRGSMRRWDGPRTPTTRRAGRTPRSRRRRRRSCRRRPVVDSRRTLCRVTA